MQVGGNLFCTPCITPIATELKDISISYFIKREHPQKTDVEGYVSTYLPHAASDQIENAFN